MFKIGLISTALVLSACAPHASEKVAAPQAINMPRPVYPFYAVKNHISGYVKFTYDVNAEGKVNGMRITESVPDHLFDDAVITAAAKWRFEQNKPAKNIAMTVDFKLKRPE